MAHKVCRIVLLGFSYLFTSRLKRLYFLWNCIYNLCIISYYMCFCLYFTNYL